MTNQNQKGIASLLAIIIVIVVGVLAIGGVLAYQYWWAPEEEAEEKEEREPEKKSITLLSPNGEEEWKWATTQEIKWEFSPEVERKIINKEIITLSIDIHSEEGSWHIYREDNLDKDFTSMQWRVGDAGVMPGGFGQTPFYEEHPQPIPNEQYKIRVCGGTSETFYEICDESDDYFSIVKKGETADWNVYRNEEYGFEVKYPENSEIIEFNKSEAYFKHNIFHVINIQNKEDIYTNLKIYADNDEDNIKLCLTEWVSSQPPEIKEVNGIGFYNQKYADSAMGGFRSIVDEYRTIYNNYCYRIESVVHFFNRADFLEYSSQEEREQALKEEEEKNEIWTEKRTKEKNNMLSTFRFID